jgi:hypothetical protein
MIRIKIRIQIQEEPQTHGGGLPSPPVRCGAVAGGLAGPRFSGFGGPAIQVRTAGGRPLGCSAAGWEIGAGAAGGGVAIPLS